MNSTFRFDTPASLRDVCESSTFYKNWHEFVKSEMEGSDGGLVKGENDGAFYSPTAVDVEIAASKTMTWMGFPRRVLLPNLRDHKEEAYKEADETDRSDTGHAQDEYFEWNVQENMENKIQKVTFVTELREYYEKLWEIDPGKVHSLYKNLVNQSVTFDDIRKGNEYNPFNKWNVKDGILHYTRSINSLNAAIGLAKTLIQKTPSLNNYYANPEFANYKTSVDPRASYDVNMLVRNRLYVSLKEPIGIYIVDWDNSGITLPNGCPAPIEWWQPKRGSEKDGTVMRLEYEVPPKEGLVVGDLLLGGQPIKYGGQLAEHITVGLAGVAGAPITKENINVIPDESFTQSIEGYRGRRIG